MLEKLKNATYRKHTTGFYLDETIDINLYDVFQKKLSSRIEKYKIEILELEKQCSSLEPLDVRIENAKKSIRKLYLILFFNNYFVSQLSHIIILPHFSHLHYR